MREKGSSILSLRLYLIREERRTEAARGRSSVLQRLLVASFVRKETRKKRGGVRRSFFGRTSVIDNHGSRGWGVRWSRSREEGKASSVLDWTEKKRKIRMKAAVNHRNNGVKREAVAH
ncbi:hypothetical protein Lser_V15G18862 [Lactuca serriola]